MEEVVPAQERADGPAPFHARRRDSWRRPAIVVVLFVGVLFGAGVLLRSGVDVAAAASQAVPAGGPTVHSEARSTAGAASLHRDPQATPRRGGTMVQYSTNEYVTLNNVTRGTGAEEALCRLFLFPPLLDLDPDTLELVPLLAAELPQVSADRLTYTWKLRPGVRWQKGRPDGTPVDVTTADVEFSWKMIRDPAVPAPAIRGALSAVKEVKAIDALTFTVEVKEPYFKTPFEFGTNFRLMPAHLCDPDPAKFADGPLSRAPVGYGPYRFVTWKPKEYVELERNPDWFAADRMPYYVDRMRIRFVKDVAQVPALFEQGEISIGTVNDVARWEQLKVDPAWDERATFHEYYLTQCIYIVWNHAHPAFKDARVRRAMTMLYPRERVRDAKYLGHAAVLSGPWPVTAPEYDPGRAPLPFDPAVALVLLGEAGFADHDGDGILDRDGVPFRFELSVPNTTTPALEAGGNWFQVELHKVGVEMTVRPVDSKQLFSVDLPQRKFDGAQVGWSGDPRDDDLFERFHSAAIDHGRNYCGYADPACDHLIEAWRREFDPAKRADLVRQLQAKLAEDQPCTFLFNPQSLVLATTRLRNVNLHRLGARWHDWWFAAE